MRKGFLFFLFITSLVSCSFLKNKLEIKGREKDKSAFNILWSKNHDPSYQTGNLPVALNGPLLHEGIVFAGHNKGEMRAYDVKTGKIIWTQQDAGIFHSTPIIYEESLIYGTGQGRLFSRDMVSGKLKFSVELGSGIESQGVIYKDRLYLHLRNHKIFCMDAKTGSIIWSYKRPVGLKTTLQRVSRPLLKNDKLYVGFADGYVASFSALDGSIFWEKKISAGSKFIDIDSTPKIFFGKLFIGSPSGDIHVLDPKTGRALSRLAYSSLRSPKLIDNRILLGTKKGTLIFVDESLNVLKESKNLGGSITNIVEWKDSILVVGTLEGNLFAINKKTLSVIDSMYFGFPSGPLFGDFSIDKKYLGVLSSRNRLHLMQ
jgi:outer membrane protein assembly factor BamB